MSRNAHDERNGLAPVFTDAGHPDEGTLKSWLDEQFDATHARRVDAHVETCAACKREVASLRGFDAAASRLLASLDPIGMSMPRSDARRTTPVSPRTRAPRDIGSITRIAAAMVAVVGGASWLLMRGADQKPNAVANDVRAPSLPVPTVAVAPRVTPAPTPNTDTLIAGKQIAVTPRVERAVATSRAVRAAVAPSVVDTAPSRVRSATVVVNGTVRVAETRAPIEGAQVLVAGNPPVMTDSAGRFRLTALRPIAGDSVTVRVRRIGYTATTLSQAASTDSITFNVSMPGSLMMLSEVVTRAGRADMIERRVSNSVAAVTVASVPVGQDFSGKGVAGGTARGVAMSPPPASFAPRIDESTRRNRAVLGGGGNREQYDRINDNPFLAVKGNPRSTFSVDVDRASYGNMRRFINDGGAPPPDAVRIEELINYFTYDLDAPRGNAPVAITTETMPAPWQPKHRLMRVALQARRVDADALPPNNLVFLIDVSGSMSTPDKLPLVKSSLRLLVDQLRPQDRVALVVYAGAAGLVLPSTGGSEKATIVAAIDRLESGGSTAGGAGIELAYRTAKANFLANGNNRVILATDGDFNVGASSDGDMERLIEQKRAEGTYLSVLGFGRGNIQDAKMQKLAKQGNGNYAYVDDIAEARKTLVAEMGATLLTVANDVKLQVEFNPSEVSAYRLIGYEDRLLATEDFSNDRKDAGDMGAGHSVTALYEIVPVGVKGTVRVREQDALRYAVPSADASGPRAARGELAYVNMRYKTPGDSTSVLVAQPVRTSRSDASAALRWAASVASFGMVLRSSEHRGTSNLESVLEMARGAKGRDAGGYRAEFIGLVEKLLACRKAERASCAQAR